MKRTFVVAPYHHFFEAWRNQNPERAKGAKLINSPHQLRGLHHNSTEIVVISNATRGFGAHQADEIGYLLQVFELQGGAVEYATT